MSKTAKALGMDTDQFKSVVAEWRAQWIRKIVAIVLQVIVVGGAVGGIGLWAAEKHFVTNERHSADISALQESFTKALDTRERQRMVDTISDLELELEFAEEENTKRLIRAKIKRLQNKLSPEHDLF